MDITIEDFLEQLIQLYRDNQITIIDLIYKLSSELLIQTVSYCPSIVTYNITCEPNKCVISYTTQEGVIRTFTLLYNNKIQLE